MNSETKLIAAMFSMVVMTALASYAISRISCTETIAATGLGARPYGSIWFGPYDCIMNVDFNEDSGQPEYIGEALPGTGDDEPGWRIYNYTFAEIDGDLEPVKVRFADGNTNFDKVWDNREEYIYS